MRSHSLEDLIQFDLIDDVEISPSKNAEAYQAILEMLEPHREEIEVELEEYHNSCKIKTPWADRRKDRRKTFFGLNFLPAMFLEDVLKVFGLGKDENRTPFILESIEKDRALFCIQEPAEISSDIETALRDHDQALNSRRASFAKELALLKKEALSFEFRVRSAYVSIERCQQALTKIRLDNERKDFERFKAKFEPEDASDTKAMTWLCMVMAPDGGLVAKRLTIEDQIAYWRACLLSQGDVNHMQSRIETERKAVEARTVADLESDI